MTPTYTPEILQQQTQEAMSVLNMLGVSCGMMEAVFLRQCIRQYQEWHFETPMPEAVDRLLNTYYGMSLTELCRKDRGKLIMGQWVPLVSQDEFHLDVDPEFQEYMRRKQKENELI